jgi:predicted phosphodiesterase
MKAQLLSDLHTEFHKFFGPLEFLRWIPYEPDLDFLFLLGDIVVPGVQDVDECRQVFEYLGTKAKHVLYVVGNHEYYGSLGKDRTDDILRYIMPSNMVWLDNNDVTLDGVHFYGGAMWFPDQPFNRLHEHEINDFSLIPDIHDWVYQSNARFRENGADLIRTDTIVLTHHLPSRKSTPPMYRESTTNCFFVSDEERLIEASKPSLWLHGHTHHPCEYTLCQTQVVCNPYGYPAERKRMGPFKPTVFEFEPKKFL